MAFTRASIVDAFTEIGEAMHRRRKVADISVFGGCAMILQYDVARSGDLSSMTRFNLG